MLPDQEILPQNIFLWLFNVERFDKLRTHKGCEKLNDLLAVAIDKGFIRQLRGVFNIPQDNVWIDDSVTAVELKNRWKQMRIHIMKMTKSKTPCFYFVYCGGHGHTVDEHGVFMLNSEKPSPWFNLESQLRFLVKDADCKGRICAIFDMCRINLPDFGKKTAKGIEAGTKAGESFGKTHGTIEGEKAGRQAAEATASEVGMYIGEMAGRAIGERLG